MSKNKPKSAMATFLEKGGMTSMLLDAGVGVSERESMVGKKNLLESENSSDLKIIIVQADECALWEYYDRPESELGDLESLSHSMQQHGQQEPILVRPASQKSHPKKYEIIFGNRRWRAAKMANIPLTAIVKPLSDQQAALCQKEENENRKEISDYAKAISYRKLIEQKVFSSESDLCEKMGFSKKTLNDIMAFLRVPDALRHKIPNYADISRITALKISTLAKDSHALEILLEQADKIGQKILNANNLDHFIETYSLKKKIERESISTLTIPDEKGRAAISIKPYASGAITINLDKRFARKLSIDSIRDHMEILLDKISE